MSPHQLLQEAATTIITPETPNTTPTLLIIAIGLGCLLAALVVGAYGEKKHAGTRWYTLTSTISIIFSVASLGATAPLVVINIASENAWHQEVSDLMNGELSPKQLSHAGLLNAVANQQVTTVAVRTKNAEDMNLKIDGRVVTLPTPTDSTIVNLKTFCETETSLTSEEAKICETVKEVQSRQ